MAQREQAQREVKSGRNVNKPQPGEAAQPAKASETSSEPQEHVPHLDELRWRVDVAISTSSMSRVLKPTVLMETTLTDGTIQTFELSVEKFHELRYNVARVLKDMEDIEKLNVMKIKK